MGRALAACVLVGGSYIAGNTIADSAEAKFQKDNLQPVLDCAETVTLRPELFSCVFEQDIIDPVTTDQFSVTDVQYQGASNSYVVPGIDTEVVRTSNDLLARDIPNAISRVEKYSFRLEQNVKKAYAVMGVVAYLMLLGTEINARRKEQD